MEPFIWLLGAAPAAGAAATYRYASEGTRARWRAMVVGDIKATPGAVKHKVDQKIADLKTNSIREVKDPISGISQYRNVERDVVDFGREIDKYQQLGYQENTNPNRKDNPGDGIF